jgi:hypothetical protein
LTEEEDELEDEDEEEEEDPEELLVVKRKGFWTFRRFQFNLLHKER